MSSKATCKACLQVQAEAARLRARVAELEAKVNDATENLLPLVVSWAFQYASEHGLNTAVHDVHKKLILPWLTQEQSERIFRDPPTPDIPWQMLLGESKRGGR